MQPGDGFSGPLFPRGGNNAGRDPDNRVALFLFPCADPALRAALSEKFLRQFFPTGRALPKTEHRKPHFKLSPGRAQAVWLRARSSRLRHILRQSPRAGGPAMMTLWWGFGRPGAHVARGLRYGGSSEPHTSLSFFGTTTLNRATVPSFGWLTLSITGRCMDLFGVIVHSSQQSPLHP